MRNQLYAEELKNARVARKATEVLLPVLRVLEEFDVPVERVSWSGNYDFIKLKPEVKLTQEAFDAVIALGAAFSHKAFESSKIAFYFVWRGKTFSIDNADDTCKVKKIVEYEPVPAHTREVVRYEQVGDCAGIETGGD